MQNVEINPSDLYMAHLYVEKFIDDVMNLSAMVSNVDLCGCELSSASLLNEAKVKIKNIINDRLISLLDKLLDLKEILANNDLNIAILFDNLDNENKSDETIGNFLDYLNNDSDDSEIVRSGSGNYKESVDFETTDTNTDKNIYNGGGNSNCPQPDTNTDKNIYNGGGNSNCPQPDTNTDKIKYQNLMII